MREFEFKYVDNYLKYNYNIPFWYYRIRFRKVRNKNLYYLIFADKYDGNQKNYINLASGDIYYGYKILSDYLNFDWKKQELENELKQRFQYEMIKNTICFLKSECDKIIDWFESIKILNKLVWSE